MELRRARLRRRFVFQVAGMLACHACISGGNLAAQMTIARSERSAIWSGQGFYFCDEPPIGECDVSESGGLSTLEIGSFVVPDPGPSTLGAGQTSEVTVQGISGTGAVTGALLRNLFSSNTVASSLLSVTFTLDQPHEYHLVASSHELLPDDTGRPRQTDALWLIGSDFRGWTEIGSHRIGDIGGATEFFWEADQAGILAPGEYSFVANFSAALEQTGPSFIPMGDTRTFHYSLSVRPVPEPGPSGLFIWSGISMLAACARHRSKRCATPF